MKDTIECIVGLRNSLSSLEFKLKFDADYKATVGSTLLPASIDLGVAAARLVAADKGGMWMPAHALFRMQLEYFVRGAFFLGPATQRQADRFLSEDVLPKRSAGVGKKKPIWMRKMMEECASHYGWGKEMLDMHDGLSGGLNSLVHGGNLVSKIYWSGDYVGSDKVSESDVADLMNNPLSLSAQAAITLFRYPGFTMGGDLESFGKILERARTKLTSGREKSLG